jgi:hypothetical protein
MEVTKPRCSDPNIDIRMAKFIILNVRIKGDMKEAFILWRIQILIDVNRELGGWHVRNLTEKTERICLCLRLECIVENGILYCITGILYNIMM